MGELEDLERFLVEDLSKDRMLNLVKNSPDLEKLASDLWILILKNKNPLSWRATWFFEHIGDSDKEVLRPYLNLILDEIPNFKYDGQKRSSLKVLLMFPLQYYDYGRAFNICFDLFISRKEALAVRVHAMQIVFDISMIEPELKPEIKEAIQFAMTESSVGFMSRSRKLLKKLS